MFPEVSIVPEKPSPPSAPGLTPHGFLARPAARGPSTGDQGVCLEEGDSRDQSPPGECSPPSAESFRKERVF